MNLSIFDELELFSQELKQHMSPHALEQLARDIGINREEKDNVLDTFRI